ncbi:MAG: triose-phosphate isomerase [Desulfobacterales bacterium]
MTMRIPLIAGNWKMYKNVAESVQTADRLNELTGDVTGVEIMIAPTFPALFPVSKALQGSLISVGAQNMHWEKEGAFTGEISATMLVAAGCLPDLIVYVISGYCQLQPNRPNIDQLIGT